MSEAIISREELQLAARNHGLPLEALRWDVTPIGLHYLLTHYDIPAVDAASWRLELGGSVSTPLTLTLDDLRERPAHEVVATMECAGNGRVHVEPHVVSQPWLLEAVGTARWRGVRLAELLDEAGVGEGVVEVLFTGLDRGVEGDEEQSYARSIPLSEALRDDVIVAYDMNGVPLPPQHGFPLRLLVPGWYGMTSVKWLARIEAVESPFDGYQQRHSYRLRQAEEDVGEPLSRIRVRALLVPPGIPDFATRVRTVEAGEHVLEGRAWSGQAPVDVGGGLGRRRRDVGDSRPRAGSSRGLGLAPLELHLAGATGSDRALLPRNRRGGEHPAARVGLEPRRLREQCRAARSPHSRWLAFEACAPRESLPRLRSSHSLSWRRHPAARPARWRRRNCASTAPRSAPSSRRRRSSAPRAS